MTAAGALWLWWRGQRAQVAALLVAVLGARFSVEIIKAVVDRARRLVRQCHTQVADMHLEYEFLHNQVHRENVASIQWLRWLGFTIGTVPCGPGDEFLMFWKRG